MAQHNRSDIIVAEYAYIIIFTFKVTVKPFTLLIRKDNEGRRLLQMHRHIKYPLPQPFKITHAAHRIVDRCKRLIVGTAGYTVNQQTAIKAALGRRDQLQQHARGARCQKTQFGELNKRSPVGFR